MSDKLIAKLRELASRNPSPVGLYPLPPGGLAIAGRLRVPASVRNVWLQLGQISIDWNEAMTLQSYNDDLLLGPGHVEELMSEPPADMKLEDGDVPFFRLSGDMFASINCRTGRVYYCNGGRVEIARSFRNLIDELLIDPGYWQGRLASAGFQATFD